MKISKDIKLFTNVNEEITIFQSTGVLTAQELKQINYQTQAILPNPDWINNKTTIQKVKNGCLNKMNSSMFYGKVSDKFIELLDSLNLKDCKSEHDVFQYFRNNEKFSKEINEHITSFVESTFFEKSNDINFHAFAPTSPGRMSINYNVLNDNTIEYTGLHVDRSIIHAFGDFHKSKQRICINLGETRYVYFSPYSVDSLTSEFVKKWPEAKFEDIIPMFHEEYGKDPIYVLTLPKGHFYIAPSDNIIHDGATVYQEAFDVCCIYLGDFELFCENEVLFQ